MKFARLYLILMVMLFMQLALVSAQNDTSELTYGETIAGEITNRSFEIEYSFTGTAEDIIVIQMTPEDQRDGLSRPSVVLLDSEFGVLETVTANRDAATLIYLLPDDGPYFILATRNDGRSGDSVGAYTLVIDLVQELIPGEAIEDSVTNDTTNLYAVRSSSDFDLVYQRLDGDFYPEISVHIIESSTVGNNNLASVMAVQGDKLDRASIGLTDANTDIHIVVVSRALFSFSFSEVSVDYRLLLSIPE